MSSLLAVMSNNYEIFKRNFLPDPLQLQIFTQIFHFMDSILFNELLDRKDLCTSSNGFQIKLEISQIEGNIRDSPNS